MKRIGNIYEKIYEIENVRSAILNASKRKRSRNYVKEVLEDIDKRTLELQKTLETENFKASPYRQFQRFEPRAQKVRDIHQPKYWPDQCVHWALIQTIEPVIMKGMYDLSCGSVKGRGGHYGKKFVERWIERDRKNTKYYLKLGIRRFYQSVNCEKLAGMFERKIKDEKVLNLIREIVFSYKNGRNGLPIGNFTSQWFANFYLEGLDHYVKEKLRVKYYIRYVDDMVLFASSKRYLHRVRKEIETYIKELDLTFSKWQVCKLEKELLDFLGYRYHRKQTEAGWKTYTTMRRRNSLRIRRRAAKIMKKDSPTLADSRAMMSHLGFVKHSNSYNFKTKYLSKINQFELKEIIRNYGGDHHESEVRQLPGKSNYRKRWKTGNCDSCG